MGEKLFAIAGTLSTMVMSLVLVALLLSLLVGCVFCGWLSMEIANTPIPTPWY